MRQCATMIENKCCASVACGWCVAQTKKIKMIKIKKVKKVKEVEKVEFGKTAQTS